MRVLQISTLRTKLFLSVLLILLISYSILIYFTLSSVQHFVTTEVDQQLLGNLKLVRATLRSRSDTAVAALSQPASAQPVQHWLQAGDRRVLRDAIHRWRQALPSLDFITIVDARQRVVARFGPSEPVGEEFGLAPLLEKSLHSKEPVVSMELVSGALLRREGANFQVLSTLRGEVLTTICIIPIKDRQGTILGAILAGDVIAADDHFLEATGGLLGQSIVAGISQSGRFVASTSSAMTGELAPEQLSVLDRGHTYHGRLFFNLREFHAISEPLLNLRGELVGALTVAMTPERFMFIRRDIERSILMSVAIGALLSFGIAFMVARRLTNPLRELTEGVRRLESGDMEQRVNVGTKDELGLLAESFNRMVITLKERDATITRKNRALQELNEQLEVRVHERAGQLREQAQLQEEILSSMVEGVVVIDRQEQVVLFNPAAREIFGMGPDLLMGQPLSQVCEHGGFCALHEQVDALWVAGGRAEVALEVHGKFLKVNLVAVPDADGNVAVIVISIRDVTIEEAIDRMKTEFIATVSHELKTPLTSMKGSLQYILGKGKWLTGSERELLEICQRNTDRLIRLITSILDISTIEAGGAKFAMKPQVPGELVICAVEELRGLAMSRNVAIINTVESDLPMIFGDHDRLIQVLTNLLANAIKFSEAGKVVKVEARVDKGFLAISVTDSNRTIQESERSKLFKKFQQIDQGEGGNLGGSGLGLAISKEIIDRHGGQISHEPLFSGGNEFTITIPLFEEQA